MFSEDLCLDNHILDGRSVMSESDKVICQKVACVKCVQNLGIAIVSEDEEFSRDMARCVYLRIGATEVVD